MVSVALFGFGKMGSLVAEEIAAEKDLKLSAIIDPAEKGKTFEGVKVMDLAEAKNLKGIDIGVDFTMPESSVTNAELCAAKGMKLVIGTTGHTPEQKKRIESLSSKTAVLISPNMSVGVNVFFKIAAELARYLKDYDIELIEAHHRYKKDSPSGTAMKIAQLVSKEVGVDLEKVAKYGRGRGITGPRPDKEIGIHAIRAGDIVGEHTLLFASNSEKIEFFHSAQSRKCFASGTVKAIKFVSAKQRGLYDMWDVLGLK